MPQSLLPPGKGPAVPIGWRLGGHIAGLDTEAKGKILFQGSNPGRPVRSQTLYWLNYPGSNGFEFLVKNLIHFHLVKKLLVLKETYGMLSYDNPQLDAILSQISPVHILPPMAAKFVIIQTGTIFYAYVCALKYYTRKRDAELFA
jgi:hypothetical protein